MPPSPEVLVVGAGVSGLSCSAALRDAGFPTRVVGERTALASTSATAAAIWWPYEAGPEREVERWAFASLARFEALAAEPATGVRVTRGFELLRGPNADPKWRTRLPGFRTLDPSELPFDAPGVTTAFAYEVPVIEMPVYLEWLAERAGPVKTGHRYSSLDEALADADVVVHCAGLGARELARDSRMQPVRGQLVRVAGRPVPYWIIDDDHPAGLTYVVPRGSDVVLGGTHETGAEDERVDPSELDAIRARCASLVPEVTAAEVVSTGVGLRPVRLGPEPARREVRVERDPDAPAGKVLVHDYGHGGAGVTLSWGCAERVVELVRDALA